MTTEPENTRAPITQGIINAEWELYIKCIFRGRTISDDQYLMLRDTFYAGYHCCNSLMVTKLSDPAISNEAAELILHSLVSECSTFMEYKKAQAVAILESRARGN